MDERNIRETKALVSTGWLSDNLKRPELRIFDCSFHLIYEEGAGHRYLNLNIARPSFPAIHAWHERLCAREAFRKHVMIPFGRSFDDWSQLETEGAGVQ